MIKIAVICMLIIDAVALFIAIKDALNQKVPSKGEIGILVLAAAASIFVNVYGLELQIPILKASEDQKGVVFAEADEDATIMFAARTDDVSNIEWKTYDGRQIPIERDPTLVSYRTTFLWIKSQIQNETAHIDEYGRVYVGIPPEVVFSSLSVSYNEKEASDGKEGNKYEGYHVTADNLNVSGVVPNGGGEVPLQEFSFSPQELRYGTNDIEVTYETSSGQSLHGKTTVYADRPKLISLTAAIRDSGIDFLPLGTTLESSMFEVTGTYEGGKKHRLDGFEISPIKLEEEGRQSVTISKDGLSKSVSINVVNPESISEREKEGNDSPNDANKILVNANYSGNLSNDRDVDYYWFSTKSKGSARISFRHAKLSNDDPYWTVSLLSSDSNVIIEKRFYGGATEDKTSLARIGPGKYYIKVEGYSDEDYTFTVAFSEEDQFFETEPNDGTETASDIVVNSDNAYTGNLTTDGDNDYYKFSLPQKGKVRIDFSHDKYASGDRQWDIALLGDARGEIAVFSSHGDETIASSDCVRIKAGEYYVHVKCHQWNDVDYHLSIQYQEEDDGAETEPNEDIPSATPLTPNRYMIGNIQSDEDVDYYSFSYSGAGDLWVSFTHEMVDKFDTFWTVSLHGGGSGTIANMEGADSLNIHGNDSEEVRASWNGLAPGTYYIGVKKYNYNNGDYKIFVAA